MRNITNTVTLNNGAEMPLLGLGLHRIPGNGEAARAIRDAAALGYRLFDTASSFKNEEDIGAGIRSCGVPRDELFITTKVWNTAQRMGTVEDAFRRSLDRLGLEYVDLYLMHWPVPGCYLDTWHVMEKLLADGRARAIGVCNCRRAELEQLLETSEIVPCVNQTEYHPLNNKENLRVFCRDRKITLMASAPLARGAYLTSDSLAALAEKYGRSIAQIGLRWLIQKGIAVLPRTANPEHMLENSRIFDFSLTEEEMETVDSLHEGYVSTDVPEDMLTVL